ncbi:THO complex subunit 1 [Sarotherodon galilaeus]
MNGRGDGSENNCNGRQVNPEMFPSGAQEPAYEPIAGLWGLLNNLYLFMISFFGDNNANVDNNDHNAAVVVVGIESDDSDEAFEDCVDVHQYIPEEDPQPAISRRRSFLMMTLTSSLLVTLIARAVLMLVILLMRTSISR